MSEAKKLYKSKDKTVFGVCGGIAEYFGCDKTIVYILTIVIMLATAVFPVAITYLVLAMVIPDKPSVISEPKSEDTKDKDDFNF